MTYGFLDTLTTQAVRAAQDANGVGGFWEEMEVDLPQDPTRGGLHCRTRQLLHGQHLEVWLAEYPALRRAQGLPAAAGRPGPGLHRIRRKPPVADGRKRLGRGPRGPLPDGLSQPAPAEDPRTHDLAAEPELASRLGNTGYRARPERAFTLKLQAFDWNCPQHITPQFTEAEFMDAMAAAPRSSATR